MEEFKAYYALNKDKVNGIAIWAVGVTIAIIVLFFIRKKMSK